jgi:Mg2+-importing ATPase
VSITPKAPSPELPDALTAVRVASAPIDEVLGWLDSSAGGLSSAEVPARRARYGPNAVRTHHVKALAVLGRQLRSAVLILLAATAAVSYFLGDSIQAVIRMRARRYCIAWVTLVSVSGVDEAAGA